MRASSDLAQHVYRRGFRIDCRDGRAISPEGQVRRGLEIGWRYHDIAYFMKSTGIAPEIVRRAIRNVRTERMRGAGTSRRLVMLHAGATP